MEKAAGAFSPIAVVFLLGLAAGILVNLILPFPIWKSAWIALIGVIPIVTGTWFFVAAGRTFKRHNTPLMPWKPTSELVSDGPYKYSRNPIYLAFALWYLSVAFFFNSAYILILS
ncbi:MAG: hypothetical protein JRN20_05830 [Nitrososphaerota archaeon]|nr:hypothetical protein [Nitrososphaerota archaeon]MDG6923149.1 hypothetical protein [Nitrososphaerota archaeon]